MDADFTAPVPLLGGLGLERHVGWRAGQPLRAGVLLARAQWLAAHRIPQDADVLNLVQDRLHHLAALLAAALAGRACGMPPNLRPATLARLRERSRAARMVAFTDDPALPAVLARCGIEAVSTRAPHDLPEAQTEPSVPAARQAVTLHTSGSTGEPQPQPKSWGMLRQNIAGGRARWREFLAGRDPAGVAVLTTVPTQHSYGLESGSALALLGGTALAAEAPFHPFDVAAALAALPRPRALVTTPLHLKALLAAGLPALPPCELVVSATAPLAPSLAQAAEDALGGRMLEIYGCTEVGQVASRRPRDGDVWTTFGELRLAQREGEGDGPRTFCDGGHLAEATPLADRIELIDAHHFRLVGRADDLIHVAGKRSSLAELNHHLGQIEGVRDGAFWLPPDEGGERAVRPLAFVVAPGVPAERITSALRGAVEGAFVPRRVVHVPRLPREATGKLAAGRLARFGAAARAAPVLAVDASHPGLDGHFPGRPLLPGAAVLGWVVAAATRRGLTVAGVAQAKFLRPMTPGSRWTLHGLPAPEAAPEDAGETSAMLTFEMLDEQGEVGVRGALTLRHG